MRIMMDARERPIALSTSLHTGNSICFISFFLLIFIEDGARLDVPVKKDPKNELFFFQRKTKSLA